MMTSAFDDAEAILRDPNVVLGVSREEAMDARPTVRLNVFRELNGNITTRQTLGWCRVPLGLWADDKRS